MKIGLLLLAAAALLTTACGETNEATTGGGGSAGSGSGGAGGSGGSEPAKVEPAQFDCTAAKPPERVNAIAVGCATDPKCTSKLVSGHRGVGGTLGVIAPEHTLAAARAAIVLGLDFIETDPRPTKDGFLVNLRDETVDRTTDGTGVAEELTLAEIQALGVDAEQYPGDFTCEHVPTLEQVLLAAKGKIHVLVNADRTDRVDLMVAAIQGAAALDWAIFATDSIDKIDEALVLEPALHTMLRVATPEDLDLELTHFAAHPPVIIEIQEGSSPLKMVPPIHAAQHRAFTNVFSQDVSAGLEDKADAYDQTIANGLDILQSDRPELVLRALDRWPPAPQP